MICPASGGGGKGHTWRGTYRAAEERAELLRRLEHDLLVVLPLSCLQKSREG